MTLRRSGVWRWCTFSSATHRPLTSPSSKAGMERHHPSPLGYSSSGRSNPEGPCSNLKMIAAQREQASATIRRKEPSVQQGSKNTHPSSVEHCRRFLRNGCKSHPFLHLLRSQQNLLGSNLRFFGNPSQKRTKRWGQILTWQRARCESKCDSNLVQA